ncbi:hypothetical protein ACLKA7_001272 [Drosophila subpalustris]
MHYAGYSDTQILRRFYENAAPEYNLYWPKVEGQRAASAGRLQNPSLAPGGRPLNPFRASPEAVRAPAVGVPALPAPGDAANQMMTQSAGSGFNSRRACHRSGSGRRQYSRDPAVRSPLVVEGGRIVATVDVDGKAMTATLDTGATRSFISEDCVRRLAIQGETQIVQTRILLADGSTLEVGRLLRVDVGMAGKVVTMPMLIMPSLMDHILLGMDFLCEMGATVRCGNAELVLETAAELAGLAGRTGEPPKGVSPGGGRRSPRRRKRRRTRKTPVSSRRPSSIQGGTNEELRTKTARPDSNLAATIVENEANASGSSQAKDRGVAPRETLPQVGAQPQFVR